MAKQLDKASHVAQDKIGKIEMFSPKYYAACTFGGLLACVRLQFIQEYERSS
jgi:solute carrier family 25 phosphate transporter 3